MASTTLIARELDPVVEETGAERTRKRTLGNVRLRHAETKKLIMIPAPTSDPNDPLNWPQWYKQYVAALICLAMMMCNFLAAGPTIAIVETALEFFPSAALEDALLSEAIAKTAYFFTTTALLQGIGNFLWMPLCNKYGRRPVYVASYSLYLGCAIWLIFERSYAGFLAGRVLMGLGAGAAETIAPVSIADVFFLHERCTIMALYTCFLSIGVALGLIISGLITINHDWRVIYEVAAALVGLVLLLAFFTFPETAYQRDERFKASRDDHSALESSAGEASTRSDLSKLASRHGATAVPATTPPGTGTPGRTSPSEPVVVDRTTKHSYLQSLRVVPQAPLTSESLWTLFARPLGLVCLPPVLWAALVQSVTIGFLVAVTSNVAPAFRSAYGFEPYQVGLCFVAAVVGSLLGIPAGGHLGDAVADFLTRRNGGVRDPEMRLPGMMLCLVTTPLALVLFGVGIEHRLHWMCPTVGLGLLNFSIAQGTNIALVYVIDAYRPVAGEVTLTVMGFKSLFGFLLSFYTNPWVDRAGYRDAYGAMAGVAAAVLILWVPLYVWGKRVRHATWSWTVVAPARWADDREVGE